MLLGGCEPRVSGAERTRSLPRTTIPSRSRQHIPSKTGRESLTYTVQLDSQLTRLDVDLCARGFAMERLNAPSAGAQTLLRGGVIATSAGSLACPGEGVDVPRPKTDDCLHYGVTLPQTWQDPSALRRTGDDLLASPDLWLWVPTPRPLGLRAHARFKLPEGVAPVLPWSKSGSDFEIPETAFEWKAGGGFAHSQPRTLNVAGAAIDLAVLGEGDAKRDGEVRAWLSEGARTTSSLFGHFPVPHALVLVVMGERKGATFGMALRGGGPAVVLFLDARVSAATLRNDWTSTHEFLHLAVPRLPPEDAWLFEGLATYYTEVARARAGIITPRVAYQHLLAGFARGRGDEGSRPLREESAQMRAHRSFYRVYWAGAAIALLTDLAARRAGGPTLDDALRAFADCCAASEEEWDAARVLARLDATLGAPRFADEAKNWLDRPNFPDTDAAARALGIRRGPRDEAIFVRSADAGLRDAIMRADPAR